MPDRPLRTVTRASSTVIRAISQRDSAILEALDEGYSVRAVADAADLTEGAVAKLRDIG
jgi:DNA-binding NarL/FixJ family response regulator